MNFILNATKFSLYDIVICDKKRNIVIDGTFSKIIYSNEFVVMNAIYINVPLISLTVIKCEDGFYLQYNQANPTNARIIQDFIKMEYQLLDYYAKFNNTHCNIITSLTKRLQSGKFKISDMSEYDNNEQFGIMVKISGIWETSNEIGLASKFIPVKHLQY